MHTQKAPPMDAVIFHVKSAIKNQEDQKRFIVSYVLDPDASKSVCESHKVAKYGVMPSLKGSVTRQELETIAAYLIAGYPRHTFVTLIKQMQANDKIRRLTHSPFLINNDQLPHLSRILKASWDKASLGLSAEQKRP